MLEVKGHDLTIKKQLVKFGSHKKMKMDISNKTVQGALYDENIKWARMWSGKMEENDEKLKKN